MKLNKLYIIILILLLSCSNKDENKMLTEDFQNNNDEPTSIETSTDIDGELNVAVKGSMSTSEVLSPLIQILTEAFMSSLKSSIFEPSNVKDEYKSCLLI